MTTPDRALVTAFVDALAHRDRSRLSSLMRPDIRMRALLPSRDVDATGLEADLVGDVWHAGYTFALYGQTAQWVTQQHLYCSTRDGSIATLRLICSGFRP